MRNLSSEPLRYPSAWAVNKPTLREAIASFGRHTEAYRATQTFRNFAWRIPEQPSPQSDSLSSPPAGASTPERAQQTDNPTAPRKRASQSTSMEAVPFRPRNQQEDSNYRRPSVAEDILARDALQVAQLLPLPPDKPSVNTNPPRRNKPRSSSGQTEEVTGNMASN